MSFRINGRQTRRGRNQVCEPLERRMLLCSLPLEHPVMDELPQYQAPPEATPQVATLGIRWANRGQASDGFSIFGGNANAYRAIVDAVINDWRNIIPNLNQDGGNNQLDLNIQIAPPSTGTGFSGSGGVDTL